jgi:hypothetical protein
VQSLMLLAFGVAGLMAASTIIACFKAVTNAQSAAVLITDKAVVNEFESVPIERAEGIVNNFGFVCYSALAIGAVIFIANAIRICLKLRSFSQR